MSLALTKLHFLAELEYGGCKTQVPKKTSNAKYHPRGSMPGNTGRNKNRQKQKKRRIKCTHTLRKNSNQPPTG